MKKLRKALEDLIVISMGAFVIIVFILALTAVSDGVARMYSASLNSFTSFTAFGVRG